MPIQELFVTYSGREPQSIARKIGGMLHGSEISEAEERIIVSGMLGSHYAAAAVIPGTNSVLTTRRVLNGAVSYGISLRPVLFDWSLRSARDLEWLVDAVKLPKGYEWRGAVFRDRKSSAYFDYDLGENPEMAFLFNRIMDSLPGFSMLTLDLQRKAFTIDQGATDCESASDLSGRTDSIIIEWDGRIVTEFPNAHHDDRQNFLSAVAAYSSISQAMNFGIAPGSVTRLRKAGVGHELRALFQTHHPSGLVIRVA